jgi:hypothetical protein
MLVLWPVTKKRMTKERILMNARVGILTVQPGIHR